MIDPAVPGMCTCRKELYNRYLNWKNRLYMTVGFIFGVGTGATHPLANGNWSLGLNKQHNITYERFVSCFHYPVQQIRLHKFLNYLNPILDRMRTLKPVDQINWLKFLEWNKIQHFKTDGKWSSWNVAIKKSRPKESLYSNTSSKKFRQKDGWRVKQLKCCE